MAIVTDPVARAQHNAAIEAWGERVSDAAVRMCREMVDMGGPFVCGETSTNRAAQVREGGE